MSEAKKIKLDVPKKDAPKHRKPGKRNYYAKVSEDGGGECLRERFMKPGHRGFFVTCNGRMRDCVRDSYRLLNEYADELYGPQEEHAADEGKPAPNSEEEEDISITLQKEAAVATKKHKTFRFQNVDSGAMNCLFIQTSLPDPNEIAFRLMKNLSSTKKHKSRFILRLLPIEAVCRANLKEIMDTFGALCDRYFAKEPKSYAILFNHRFNNDLSRDDVIRSLADLITSKNAGNKANLKRPDLAVLVEVIKGLCCIGILREYYELKKYNVTELVALEAMPTATTETPNDDEPNAAEEKSDVSPDTTE